MQEGILLINKPISFSSFDVIRKLKPHFPKKTKIGHSGTLDPFASGLLIICIGRSATKLVPQLMKLPKTYCAKAEFGFLTDTLDITGNTLVQDNTHIPTEENIAHALQQLQPEYVQTPPVYSALKHNGTPLYKFIRQNTLDQAELENIARSKQKLVHIYQSHIDIYDPPSVTITTTVSQGTYIRSFILDIAKKCATVATTVELTRTAIGPFLLSQAHRLQEKKERVLEHIIPTQEVVQLLH